VNEPILWTLPALLIGSLLLMAAATYIVRGWERVAALLAAGYAAALALFFWRLEVESLIPVVPVLGRDLDLALPLTWMGFTLQLQSAALPGLAMSFGLAAVAFVLAARVSQGRTFVPLTLGLLAGYSGVAFITSAPLPAPLLIPIFLVALSALGVYALQAGRIIHPAGPLRSMIPPLIAFPFFLVAFWYIEQIPLNPQDVQFAQRAAQLLGMGLVLILAPVPLHGAQPAVARFAPPIAAALLLLLYQMALLQLFFHVTAQYSFWEQDISFGIWLTWAGIFTAVWGGLAAAGANHPGRLWGDAAVHDWGLILMVLAVPGEMTRSLVLFLFGLRAISMLTATAGLSVLEENAGGLDLARLRGAGSRLPWNSAAFLIGGLGLAGFPLSAGFTGHWAAIQLVAASDWRQAAAVLIASGGAILGFIRVARILFGPLENRLMLRERPLSAALAAATLLFSIGLAIAPQLLDAPVSRALLAFIR
jgi:NADH:ubiquinone oxidoreductase subunit 2 (subunit N)